MLFLLKVIGFRWMVVLFVLRKAWQLYNRRASRRPLRLFP